MRDEFTRSVEATLFASAEPLTPEQIAEHVGEGDVAGALAGLAQTYAGRGIEIVERGGRWHFQTAPDLAHLLRRTREETRRLSRAATETPAGSVPPGGAKGPGGRCSMRQPRTSSAISDWARAAICPGSTTSRPRASSTRSMKA